MGGGKASHGANPETISLDKLFSQRGLQPHYVKENESIPEQTVVRERFANKIESVLTFIAYVVGPGNVWRFPYLVIKNGGTLFVLLYIFILVVVTIPVSFLELALGQYSGKNMVRVWDLSPAFRGVGFSFLFVCWVIGLNFQLIMTHCLLYALASVGHHFAWSVCKKDWKNCFSDFRELRNWTQVHNISICTDPQAVSMNCMCHENIQVGCSPTPKSAASFFYYEEILKVSRNSVPVEEFGTPSWTLAVVLLCSWTLVTLCTLRGIRYTSKFLYVTVSLPYIGLLILGGRAAALPGAMEGLQFLFGWSGVKWYKILNSEMWVEAVGQAMLSLSSLLAENFILGSYNNFRNKSLHRDLLLVATVDTFTSLLAAMAVFLTLGHSSYLAGPHFSITDIVRSDLGLSFLTFPTSLKAFPITHLWTIIFFIILYTLAIDTMFGLVETVLTYLQDDFRIIRRNTVKTRVLFGVLSYFCCFILACPGGYHLVKVVDTVAVNLSLPILGLIEITAVMWGYGVRRFLKDLEYMLALKLSRVTHHLLVVLYAAFLPVVFLLLFLSIVTRGFPDLMKRSPASGVLMVIAVLSPVPMWFFLYTWKTCKDHKHLTCKQRMWKLLKPAVQWGPNDGSNIHRCTDTVFTDLFDSLKKNKRRNKRSRHRLDSIGFRRNVQEPETIFDSLYMQTMADIQPSTHSAQPEANNPFRSLEIDTRTSEHDSDQLRRNSMP